MVYEKGGSGTAVRKITVKTKMRMGEVRTGRDEEVMITSQGMGWIDDGEKDWATGL